MFSRFKVNLPPAASKWLDDYVKSAIEKATVELRNTILNYARASNRASRAAQASEQGAASEADTWTRDKANMISPLRAAQASESNYHPKASTDTNPGEGAAKQSGEATSSLCEVGIGGNNPPTKGHGDRTSPSPQQPRSEPTANVHIEHYFSKGYDPQVEPWKSITTFHRTALEQAERSGFKRGITFYERNKETGEILLKADQAFFDKVDFPWADHGQQPSGEPWTANYVAKIYAFADGKKLFESGWQAVADAHNASIGAAQASENLSGALKRGEQTPSVPTQDEASEDNMKRVEAFLLRCADHMISGSNIADSPPPTLEEWREILAIVKANQ